MTYTYRLNFSKISTSLSTFSTASITLYTIIEIIGRRKTQSAGRWQRHWFWVKVVHTVLGMWTRKTGIPTEINLDVICRPSKHYDNKELILLTIDIIGKYFKYLKEFWDTDSFTPSQSTKEKLLKGRQLAPLRQTYRQKQYETLMYQSRKLKHSAIGMGSEDTDTTNWEDK